MEFPYIQNICWIILYRKIIIICAAWPALIIFCSLETFNVVIFWLYVQKNKAACSALMRELQTTCNCTYTIIFLLYLYLCTFVGMCCCIFLVPLALFDFNSLLLKSILHFKTIAIIKMLNHVCINYTYFTALWILHKHLFYVWQNRTVCVVVVRTEVCTCRLKGEVERIPDRKSCTLCS